MVRRELAVLAVLLAAGLYGCVQPDPSTAGPVSLGEGSARPVVIAVLDSGTNPYLPIFALEAGRIAPFGLPAEARTVPVTPGLGPENGLRDDEAILSALGARTLYHFAGTRLLAIGFRDNMDTYPQTIDTARHGIGTTYLAAREAPKALIVSVQVSLRVCGADTSCSSDPTVADGMEWIAAQEWIDIVSVSMGMPGNAPDASELHPEMARYLRASEAAALTGKIILNSAGNDATPVLVDYQDGPPWVVTVGGVERNGSGEAVLASKIVDVVANFTDIVPLDHAAEYGWRAGTSNAAPIVAGTLAEALHLVRQRDAPRVVPAQDLRDALNASAVYFSAADWDPRPPGRHPDPVMDAVEAASLPIATQAQMGWGYVNASLAPEIARRVLEHDLAPPASKGQAMLFQPAWQQAREEFWARYGR